MVRVVYRLKAANLNEAAKRGIAEFLTPDGDLRTLPCQFADPDPRLAGHDGFFAARLERV